MVFSKETANERRFKWICCRFLHRSTEKLKECINRNRVMVKNKSVILDDAGLQDTYPSTPNLGWIIDPSTIWNGQNNHARISQRLLAYQSDPTLDVGLSLWLNLTRPGELCGTFGLYSARRPCWILFHHQSSTERQGFRRKINETYFHLFSTKHALIKLSSARKNCNPTSRLS